MQLRYHRASHAHDSRILIRQAHEEILEDEFLYEIECASWDDWVSIGIVSWGDLESERYDKGCEKDRDMAKFVGWYGQTDISLIKS